MSDRSNTASIVYVFTIICRNKKFNLIKLGVAHSSPYNVTVVEVTENSAKINWLPPYVKEGQQYNYELR